MGLENELRLNCRMMARSSSSISSSSSSSSIIDLAIYNFTWVLVAITLLLGTLEPDEEPFDLDAQYD